MLQSKDRVAKWIRNHDPHICCLQEIHFRAKDLHRLKMKGWKKNVPCRFEYNMYFASLGWKALCIYQVSPFHLRYCSMPQYLCWYFFGRSVHVWQWSVKIPYYNCIAVNVLLEVLQDFPYVFWCSYVGCIYIYNVYVLVDCSFEYDEVTFWVSLYGPFWSLFCLIWVLLPLLFFPVHLLGKFVSSPSLSVWQHGWNWRALC